MSVRAKLQHREHVIEALHGAKFKFPGRQRIHISKVWGFPKFNADEFENTVAGKWLELNGCEVMYTLTVAPGQATGPALGAPSRLPCLAHAFQ